MDLSCLDGFYRAVDLGEGGTILQVQLVQSGAELSLWVKMSCDNSWLVSRPAQFLAINAFIRLRIS